MTGRWAGTFAGRRAAVVPELRAVPALKVVGAATGVVGRQVETAAAVLARSTEAVVHGQLGGRRHGLMSLIGLVWWLFVFFF